MTPGQRVVWLRDHCGPLDRTPAVVVGTTARRVRLVYGRRLPNGQWTGDRANVTLSKLEDASAVDVMAWCPDADERRAVLDATPFPVLS